MSKRVVYLVDANVFIEAKNRYYAFAICPGFWDAIAWHAGLGAVCSIDLVKKELSGGNDDLAGWVKTTAPADVFHSTNDADAVKWYGLIVNWVQNEPRFRPEAKAEFARAADPWLVAYAGAQGLTLVTQETSEPMSRKKVKLPDVCRQFGVKWVNTFEMLEDLSVSFGWQPPH